MLTTASAARFLAQPRITVVGASDDKSNFGGAIYRAMKEHGHRVAAVHPDARPIDGDPSFPNLASVPGPLGGVLIMVNAAEAIAVVRECLAIGVRHVWLFRGIGGSGALSDEAVALCREGGIDVVEGACPLMFLEPVGFGHRIHRSLRRARGALVSSLPVA